MRPDSACRLCILVLLLLPFGAHSAEEKPSLKDTYVVQSAWADAEKCNWDSATPVSFSTLWSSRDTGQCVRVSGVAAWRALFASLEDYYQLNGSMSSLPEKQERRRVGLYARDEMQQQFGQLQRQEVEIVGELGDCAQFQGSDVIMVLGFCHYTGGRILLVSQFRALPTKRVVLQGERARKRYGTLEPYTSNTAFRDGVEDRLRAWIAMVQSQDVAGLRQLLHNLAENATAEDGESELWLLFGREQPLAARFKDVERNPRAIFRSIDPQAQELRAEDPSYESGVACVCLQDTCGDSWPISLVDVAITRTRPYACLTVEQNGTQFFIDMNISDDVSAP